MCTHKAQKYHFCTHPAHFWCYIGLLGPAVILVRNLVEKLTKNCQFFFFQKKHFKTRSETWFHQNRQYWADFRLGIVKR